MDRIEKLTGQVVVTTILNSATGATETEIEVTDAEGRTRLHYLKVGEQLVLVGNTEAPRLVKLARAQIEASKRIEQGEDLGVTVSDESLEMAHLAIAMTEGVESS